MTAYRSPLMNLPGAVDAPAGSADAGVPWHFGDPLGEQRVAEEGAAVIDRSERFVISVAGEERLSWLHSLTTQHLSDLPDGGGTEGLVLDGNGRVEHHFNITDIEGVAWLDMERADGPEMLDYLRKMVFWAKVSPSDGGDTAQLSLLGPETAQVLANCGAQLPAQPFRAVALSGGGFARTMPPLASGEHAQAADLLIPRASLPEWHERLIAAGATSAGSWAFEALRIARAVPRMGVDSDDRALPHELRWVTGDNLTGAVHLNKGCYRGQETVARVHNMGQAPRRLVLLLLDGSTGALPDVGAPVLSDGKPVGHVGGAAQHHQLGPIALALVKKNVADDAALAVELAEGGQIAAAIDPDATPPLARSSAGREAVQRWRSAR